MITLTASPASFSPDLSSQPGVHRSAGKKKQVKSYVSADRHILFFPCQKSYQTTAPCCIGAADYPHMVRDDVWACVITWTGMGWMPL